MKARLPGPKFAQAGLAEILGQARIEEPMGTHSSCTRSIASVALYTFVILQNASFSKLFLI